MGFVTPNNTISFRKTVALESRTSLLSHPHQF